MKRTKLNILIATSVCLFALILTGYGNSIINPNLLNRNNGAALPFPQPETLIGNTEFYFRPLGDYRTWHVINRYISLDAETGRNLNMAEYTFTNDSVTVINEFAGIPEMKQWDLDLSGLRFYSSNY